MRIIVCMSFVLAASVAHAETWTTTVNRDANSVTVTGPHATVTTTQVSRSSSGATYSTTITPNGGSSYQPMGAGGYHPMGR